MAIGQLRRPIYSLCTVFQRILTGARWADGRFLSQPRGSCCLPRLTCYTALSVRGSAGTQAGLVVGMEGARTQIPVLGIGVRAPRQPQEDKVFMLAQQTADLLGVPGSVSREKVVANCDYIGAGYGIPTPSMMEAVTMLARLEGILLDPVYSGKGMAGLIDLIRKGHYRKDQNIVFLHTGGAVGLFGYQHAFPYPT